MPLVLIGEEREAHTWTGEEYKAAVRRYMESSGYAQTVDSFVEGTVEDMIFVPAGELGLHNIHIEAKNTILSTADDTFHAELAYHLRNWLAAPQSGRFDFYVFVRGLKNQAKWSALFRDASPPAIRTLLSAPRFADDSKLCELIEARWSEILTFFSRCFVVKGTREALLLAADAKEATSLGSPSRWAEEQKARMDRRVSVDPISDTLVANLIKLGVPASFRSIGVSVDHPEDLWDRLGVSQTPPCWMPSKRSLLTFDSEAIVETLTPVRTGESHLVSLASIELENPFALQTLLHQYIGKLAIAKGAVCSDGEFYFSTSKVGDTPQPFQVPGLSERGVTLSEPKFYTKKDSSAETGLATRIPSKLLNFVYHTGFRFRIERLWGDYYLSLVPHRIYTSDGLVRLPPEAADRIDRKFRDPKFNRSSGQLTKLQATADYLFGRPAVWVESAPAWYGAVKFSYPEIGVSPNRIASSLLRVQTRWKPVEGAKGDAMLEEFEPHDEDEA